MNGKSKCKILKEIRRQIALENDIAYVTSECKFQGNCSGTCPKCEAEVRYLEEELRKRQQLGKQVAVAGIAAALVIASSGCNPVEYGGVPLPDPSSSTQETEPLMGEPVIAAPTDPSWDEEALPGVLPAPTDPTEPWEGELLPDETASDSHGESS